jgi:hypothetical protein
MRIASAGWACFRRGRHGKSLREPAFEVENSSLQLGLNSGGAKIARATARDHGQRGSRREHRPEPQPKAFAQQALDTVANDRLADAARDGHPESRAIAVRESGGEAHEMRRLVADARTLQTKELAASAKFVLRPEAERRARPS